MYQVPEKRLEKTGKRPSDIYSEYFDKWGNNIESERFGDIALSKSSVKSEIRHGTTAEKLASIEAIPSVIENGEVIFFGKKESKTTDRIIVAAPITIGEEHYFMGVMLQRDDRNQRLYLHNVAIEKEAVDATTGILVTTGRVEANDRFFTTSILQNAINVKQEIRRTSENNVQDSGKDARTDADIDERVKHSLGIDAASDAEKSLAAKVTALEQINRDLERQVKDYRLQAQAGGARQVAKFDRCQCFPPLYLDKRISRML